MSEDDTSNPESVGELPADKPEDNIATPEKTSEEILDEWIDGAIAKMNDPNHPRPKVW